MTSLTQLFVCLNGFYYFRAFDGTAWIVYTLIRMAYELGSFLVVVLAVVGAFTFAFHPLYDMYAKGSDEYEDEDSNPLSSLGGMFQSLFFAGFFGHFNLYFLSKTFSESYSAIMFVILLILITLVSMNALVAAFAFVGFAFVAFALVLVSEMA